MGYSSINPATGEQLASYDYWDERRLQQCLAQAKEAAAIWNFSAMSQRADVVKEAARVLREHREHYARLITLEMGKLYTEALAEIDKCALGCEYYAEHGPEFVADEVIASDASESYVSYEPMGTVLAVMPWNFPFWQVFRFAAPTLIAGNAALLKHASNVPQCAMAIQEIFEKAGLPQHVFQTLMISASQVREVIEHDVVKAVTLTGSEPAGRQVAAQAGAVIKKSVLELGGSDPFIILEDADLALAVREAVTSRFLNSGQSCIAAKRFIVVAQVYEEFLAAFKQAVQQLQPGDPFDAKPNTLAPMSRVDLRDDLHRQVQEALDKGARAVCGCEPVEGVGAYYQPSILAGVTEDMPLYFEELFGPVAMVMKVDDEQQAISLANATRFGLGASVWSADVARARDVARRIDAGCVFINGFVKSDPRLPFGGIKASGFGRELSQHGIREFVNAKTLWIR